MRFSKSIRVSIEHGHANNYENDYSSVAYWYQIEPHAPFPVLPDVRARLPRFPDVVFQADAARVRCRERIEQLRVVDADDQTLARAREGWQLGSRALLEGRLEDAIAAPKFTSRVAYPVLHMEGGFPEETTAALQALGHLVDMSHGVLDYFFGGVNAILVKDGLMTGVGSFRRAGGAAGGR